MDEKVLLSRNEAIAVLQEFEAPKDVTNRELLAWCLNHRAELPYSPVELLRALFPHNPQNVRDSL